MRSITERLAEEHRLLEELLDALETAIAGGNRIAECLEAAAGRARDHYERERPFLESLATVAPELAAKLTAQHDEACEIAASFQEALREGQARDLPALARRFHAIAQHNVIEEERDVFPLADRLLH